MQNALHKKKDRYFTLTEIKRDPRIHVHVLMHWRITSQKEVSATHDLTTVDPSQEEDHLQEGEDIPPSHADQ